MQVKRFLAADMRRALEMVRQELGPDAVILSSNRTKDGVELLTTRATPELPEAPAESPEASARETGEPLAGTGAERAAAIEQARLRRLAQQEVEASAREFLQPNQRVNAGISMGRSKPTGSSGIEDRLVSAAQRYPLRDSTRSRYSAEGLGLDKSAGRQSTNRDAERLREKSRAHSEPEQRRASENEYAQPSPGPELSELQAELAEMRLLLEEQLSQVLSGGQTPRPPAMASVGRRLARMGLPKDTLDSLLEGLPETRQLAQGWSDALAKLSRELPVDSSDRVKQGGIFALVGPTGAGKTTSIGKLAARYVMAHGTREVALVTLDTHRIGGHDQLRSLARILGVTFRVVDDTQSLDSVLYSLRRHSLVLVDTAGFRQGDPRLVHQMEMLAQQEVVKKLLVLPCNSQEAMLKASVHAYGGAGLVGSILTKLDESASLGEALGVIMKNNVPIVYTSDGQDIPRDLCVARAHQLVAKAAAMVSRREPTSTDRVVASNEPRSRFQVV